jgi:hypothetical protein
MMNRTLIALSLLAGSGCATAQQQQIPVRGETPGRTCDSSKIADFVGRQRSPELEAELLEASGAAIVRWVPQGAAVTMEYRSDRVTAYLDANGSIESIGCN